jgi:hypothetical protein
MACRCRNRGERRRLNKIKFWNRVKRHAKWMKELLEPDNWKLRQWVSDQHNCSCNMCRDRSRRYKGNSKTKYSIQELKMLDDERFETI